MIPEIRQQYNLQFTKEKYEAYINDLRNIYPGHLEFRLAETPVFISKDFISKVLETCESIVDMLIQPGFESLTDASIPPSLLVPNQDAQPQFLIFDFGICKNKEGELEPQLVELQAFPSIFAWHALLPEVHQKHFNWPKDFSIYLNGFNKESYINLLRKIIVGDEQPEQVILLELFPHRQKTRVDFYTTEIFLGIKTVCLTEIIQEGKKLYYFNNGKKTPINRIYNRLIFDELLQQPKEIKEKGKFFQEEIDVTWICHPNWFFRVSKYTLPFIHHRYVPESKFLNQVEPLPKDLENYVVKPLFSYAGHGVIIDVTSEKLQAIKDPENWILQKKVDYASFVTTPNEPAKAEIRIFYFWEPGSPRPVATCNLARLSKGKMIGIDYNKHKDWVGGSFCLFEE